MKQSCKNCGAPYHLNMGLFGMDEGKTMECHQCNSLIYVSSGVPISPEDLPALESPIQIIKEAIFTTPDKPESTLTASADNAFREENKFSLLIKKILFGFGLFWSLAGMALIISGLYQVITAPLEPPPDLMRAAGMCFIGFLSLNWAVLLFFICLKKD